jgi:Ca-activated chloride channel homolog
MNFSPVLPSVALFIIGGAIVVIRMIALYRVLVRTASGNYRAVVLRWSALTLAVLLLVVAGFRPAIDSQRTGPDPAQTAGATGAPDLNVFFVVDRSVNSRVEDFGNVDSRMSGIRADIAALIDEYPRARFGVISFATKAATDWPLSNDAAALRSMVKGLSPYTLVAPDAIYQANAYAARDVLRDSVAEAQKVYPGSQTLVFYFGEGEAQSRSNTGSFDVPGGAIAGGAVLGYGTPAGGPIPQGWLSGAKVYQTDPDGSGRPLNSTIDEATLKQIATQLGVPYFHREAGQQMTSVIPAVTPKPVPTDAAVYQLVERRELYWVFTLLAAALLLGEMVLTIREYRRNRMSRQDVLR